MNRQLILLFTVCCSLLQTAQAQFFLVSSVHRPANDTMAVYSLTIRNTATDSIIVFHSQETESPPFINTYRYQVMGEDSLCIFLGKSNNPNIPETYRATKTFPAHTSAEIYFAIPKSLSKRKKYIDIWYSIIDQRYETAFLRLEQIETNQNVEKCRKIKERFGKAYHRQVYY